MDNWWKSPVLQGEENDYGQYDYMIEEIPNDETKWEFHCYKDRCDSCGKESHLLFYYSHYFHTMDGWDSMDSSECWRCMVKDKIYSIKRKAIHRIKAFKLAMELYKAWLKSFKYYYELAKKAERRN